MKSCARWSCPRSHPNTIQRKRRLKCVLQEPMCASKEISTSRFVCRRTLALKQDTIVGHSNEISNHTFELWASLQLSQQTAAAHAHKHFTTTPIDNISQTGQWVFHIFLKSFLHLIHPLICVIFPGVFDSTAVDACVT